MGAAINASRDATLDLGRRDLGYGRRHVDQLAAAICRNRPQRSLHATGALRAGRPVGYQDDGGHCRTQVGAILHPFEGGVSAAIA
jgi:hypothetical protein